MGDIERLAKEGWRDRFEGIFQNGGGWQKSAGQMHQQRSHARFRLYALILFVDQAEAEIPIDCDRHRRILCPLANLFKLWTFGNFVIS
jgi:hypothetical protein